MSRRRRAAEPGTVVAYVRVSTDEQAASGAGLEAQRAAIESEVARRGWRIVEWHTDEGLSGGKGVAGRPGLAASLAAVEQGVASVLMVSKSDRLARGLRTLLDVIDRIERAGGAVVATDSTIDTSTAAGRFTTQIMGGVAELESAMISDRTKAALAAKRAAGVRLGRPSSLPSEVVSRIVRERDGGMSLPAIARGLVADGVPTAQGGAKWHPSTVSAVLSGQDAARIRAEAMAGV